MCVPFTYLGFEVNIGGGHFGNLEDADGQRDGTQHKQTVVDQDPSQDRMSDAPVAADREGRPNQHKPAGIFLYKEHGFAFSTLVIQSASELLAPTTHRLGSPRGKIYSDSGKII